MYRFVIEDLGIIFTRILHEILGSLHVLHFTIQYTHEDLLHCINCIRYLLNEIQEALLLCNKFCPSQNNSTIL
jgi:hypothetical protein